MSTSTFGPDHRQEIRQTLSPQWTTPFGLGCGFIVLVLGLLAFKTVPTMQPVADFSFYQEVFGGEPGVGAFKLPVFMAAIGLFDPLTIALIVFGFIAHAGAVATVREFRRDRPASRQLLAGLEGEALVFANRLAPHRSFFRIGWALFWILVAVVVVALGN